MFRDIILKENLRGYWEYPLPYSGAWWGAGVTYIHIIGGISQNYYVELGYKPSPSVQGSSDGSHNGFTKGSMPYYDFNF